METSINKTMNVPEKNKNTIYNNVNHKEKYDCKLETFSYQELGNFLIHSFILSK